MIYLRPHHLLCTQGYSGKGYSEGFVSHMNEVVDELRNRPGTKITLTFSTDTLCSCCPHKEGEDLCDTQEKVKRFDQKVVDYFGLEEKEYSYQELCCKAFRTRARRKKCSLISVKAVDGFQSVPAEKISVRNKNDKGARRIKGSAE